MGIVGLLALSIVFVLGGGFTIKKFFSIGDEIEGEIVDNIRVASRPGGKGVIINTYFPVYKYRVSGQEKITENPLFIHLKQSLGKCTDTKRMGGPSSKNSKVLGPFLQKLVVIRLV
jgi:hypothetical protein